MFEIGRWYNISYGTHDNWESTYGQCTGWNHPLLNFQEVGKDEVIVNTANSSFLRAETTLAPGERRIPFGNFGSLADQIKDE